MSVPTQPKSSTASSSVRSSLESRFSRAYGAQLTWSERNLKQRLAIINRIRGLLVRDRREIAGLISNPVRQSFSETLTTEIMPLADAAGWLYRRARSILSPRYCQRRHTPFWLGLIESSVHRIPHGLVMIIGAGNYPVFLTGVQILHAIAAGNAVVIKPALGAELVTQRLLEVFQEAGVPSELFVLLDSSIESAQLAMEIGVDKVVLTGSSKSGRAVMKQLSESLTPSTMELSGCDALYVLPGADLHRVCDVLLFSMRLNGGASCLAPRRVFLPQKVSEVFHRLLAQRLSTEAQKKWRTQIPCSVFQKLQGLVHEATQQGAQFVESPDASIQLTKELLNSDSPTLTIGHLVLTNVRPEMKICSADLFAPLTMIVPVSDWAEAIHFDSMCPYALTVSVYGPLEDALRLTKFFSAGTITINDSVVPTADPQLPFGGRGESGFGVTRGDEGLLEMTFPKVITVRRGKWLPHLQPTNPADESLLDGLLQWVHGGTWKTRLNGIRQTIQAALQLRKR